MPYIYLTGGICFLRPFSLLAGQGLRAEEVAKRGRKGSYLEATANDMDTVGECAPGTCKQWEGGRACTHFARGDDTFAQFV